MDDYTICIYHPPGYAHHHAFMEVAESLLCGFKELGYGATIVNDVNQATRRAIILGANLLPPCLPPEGVVYNLEQARSGWMNEDYLQLLRRHVVWDYSTANIETLHRLGVHRIRQCQIGYAASLDRIVPAVEDIDVLFYGSIFGRRVAILDNIKSTGLNVVAAFGVYGSERDALIARSKIILNLHAREDPTFEIVRVAYLLNNRKFVLSEHSDTMPKGVVFGAVEDLPVLCRYYAAHDEERRTLAEQGYAAFKPNTQARCLRKVLMAPLSGPSDPSHPWRRLGQWRRSDR